MLLLMHSLGVCAERPEISRKKLVTVFYKCLWLVLLSWHGKAVSVSACSPGDLGSNPRLLKTLQSFFLVC